MFVCVAEHCLFCLCNHIAFSQVTTLINHDERYLLSALLPHIRSLEYQSPCLLHHGQHIRHCLRSRSSYPGGRSQSRPQINRLLNWFMGRRHYPPLLEENAQIFRSLHSLWSSSLYRLPHHRKHGKNGSRVNLDCLWVGPRRRDTSHLGRGWTQSSLEAFQT